MKVFISWSGDLSKKLADLLHTWLEDVLQGVDVWVSNTDIDKGSIWFDEIFKQLKDVGVGILCVTRSNQNAAWLVFEAGALCKGLPKNRVCPFLVDLDHSELQQPLSQFNGTLPTREDVLKLVQTINSERGEQALKDDKLLKAFDRCWKEFEEPFHKIRSSHKPKDEVEKRTPDDMIREILELSRSIQRSLQELTELRSPAGRSFPTPKEARNMLESLLASGAETRRPSVAEAARNAADVA
jgi:hypothetical protein